VTESADFDHDLYDRVLRFEEYGFHPFKLHFDYKVFFEKGDEALTLL